MNQLQHVNRVEISYYRCFKESLSLRSFRIPSNGAEVNDPCGAQRVNKQFNGDRAITRHPFAKNGNERGGEHQESNIDTV